MIGIKKLNLIKGCHEALLQKYFFITINVRLIIGEKRWMKY